MQPVWPNACDDRWMAAMRRGDLMLAWQISDAVLKRRLESGTVCCNWPRHLQFVWTGAPLAGKRVLVRCYHGLGDTIQFLRFMRPLRALASEVTVWAQPALVDLAARAAGIDRVLPLHEGTPDVGYDVDLEIMEVPHALRVSTIPGDVPYLSAPAGIPLPLKGALKVGVVWKAGDWDRRRNPPPALLPLLTEVSGLQLFSLQQSSARDRLPEIPAILGDCDTVAKTAARLVQLDLVISVDTMVAHLAGALAKPVWTLLHADCDWRWGRDQGRTVWYPTMRLFRQQCQGDWRRAVEQLRDALGTVAAKLVS